MSGAEDYFALCALRQQQPTTVDLVVFILAAHYVECTGPGEVTCRCRQGGWMSPSEHRRHIAEALQATGLLRALEDQH